MATPSTSKFLLPMEQTADVTFTFTKDGETDQTLVKAHKLILATSKVFEMMFFGSVPWQAEPVPIPDIARDTFEEMLGSMYGNKVSLSESNVFKLMYASEKYMLWGLKDKCEEFIVRTTNHINVLSIFEKSRLYSSSSIDEKCLSLLLDDPIQFFQQPGFLQISAEILKKIIVQEKINCTTDELKKATLKWLNYNYGVVETPNEFGPEFYQAAEELILVSPLHFENKQFYNAMPNYLQNFTMCRSRVENFKVNHIYLHGVALYLGLLPSKVEASTKTDAKYFNESVTIIVKKFVKFENSETTSEITLRECKTQVTQTDSIVVKKVMFEKLLIKMDQNEELKILVNFETYKHRAVLVRRSGPPTDFEYTTSVISYLIYSNWSDESLTKNLLSSSSPKSSDNISIPATPSTPSIFSLSNAASPRRIDWNEDDIDNDDDEQMNGGHNDWADENYDENNHSNNSWIE